MTPTQRPSRKGRGRRAGMARQPSSLDAVDTVPASLEPHASRAPDRPPPYVAASAPPRSPPPPPAAAGGVVVFRSARLPDHLPKGTRHAARERHPEANAVREVPAVPAARRAPLGPHVARPQDREG